jgi:hypothetical protein
VQLVAKRFLGKENIVLWEEEAYENFCLDMLKGFQCRDLSVVKSSSWKYQFFNPPLTTKVLENLKE